ncbi:MAG: hypothetical protein JNM27_11220, partial [Leptospirales bacterium]|nr:hypothetical protein [Leptospirales bacterium]
MNREVILLFAVLLWSRLLFAQNPPEKDSGAFKPPSSRGSIPFELALLTGARSGKLISDRFEARDSNERSGADMFLGVRLRGASDAEEPGNFFYTLDAGLFALAREGSKNRDKTDFAFLPGDELNAGIAFCPIHSCGLKLGRSGRSTPGGFPLHNHNATMVGGHGSQTGASLFFRGQNVSISAVPILLPAYNGRTWSDTGLPENNWQSGTQDARGFHAEVLAMFYYFGLSLHYSGVNQKQTSRLNGNSRDRIEYSGIAFLLRKPEGFVRAGFSAGFERASGRYLAMDRDETGSSMVTIDGIALSSGLDLEVGNLSWQTNFFLPEPQTKPRGSRKSTETAGYVGFGSSIVDSPTLGELLAVTPFPVL